MKQNTPALREEPTVRDVSTVLIANRGEIAVRIIRTLRAAGVRTVAVYSQPDARAAHVQLADEAILLGPAAAAKSYLDISKVIAAARRTGADAIHPGYGFLSENASFAQACQDAGIIFMGPSAAAISVMGDKISAKAAVSARGVPTVPGISRPGLTDQELIQGAAEVGYPVLVKPSAGGGGKGMRRVEDPAELPAALQASRREASSSFGDDALFIERFVDTPRHIEVQIAADAHGNVVHLGERECSLQRRHQKVIEEAPSALLDTAGRDRIGAAACDAALSVGYVGVGTVEFIVSAKRPDEFFFMEMNTRLQVEHPVTELVTGLDLVAIQLAIARNELLPVAQEDISLRGHAVEARVYAEDPAHGFLPSGGTVLALREVDTLTGAAPYTPGIRTDSGLLAGTVVGSHYDPMLSKVIAYGTDRADALARLDAALGQTAVLGVKTNIGFSRFLLGLDEVTAGQLDTGLLDRRAPEYVPSAAPDAAYAAVALHRLLTLEEGSDDSLWSHPNGFRLGAAAPFGLRLQGELGAIAVSVSSTPGQARVVLEQESIQDSTTVSVQAWRSAEGVDIVVDGELSRWLIAAEAAGCWLSNGAGTWFIKEAAPRRLKQFADELAASSITSPMPGSVIAQFVEQGATVAAGDPVLAVEAMKMEHSLAAPRAGTVRYHVTVGDQVNVDQVLVDIEPLGPTEAAAPQQEEAHV
jgi:acetyl-CoA/propionyl-CoA carboxylase biotin carboxyl carrier protein